MATGDNGQDGTGSGLTDKIKDSGGLLLIAFLGAVNFIGFSNGEISSILRNNLTAADVTALLILLAVLVAVVSSLFLKGRRYWKGWLLPIFLAVASLALIPELAIRIPTTSIWPSLYSWLSITILGLLVIATSLWTWWYNQNVLRKAPSPAAGSSPLLAGPRPQERIPWWHRRVDYQAPVLAIAVVLTVIATYAAMRAETASQDQSSVPKLDSELTYSDDVYSLAVTATAARLPSSNYVEVTVYAWPHPGKRLPAHPVSAAQPSPCQQNWCQPYPCLVAGCQVIANSFYGPDAEGSVDAKLQVTFTKLAYSNVRIIARRFSPDGTRCNGGVANNCYSMTSLVISPN
jgi:hypothetical protein